MCAQAMGTGSMTHAGAKLLALASMFVPLLNFRSHMRRHAIRSKHWAQNADEFVVLAREGETNERYIRRHVTLEIWRPFWAFVGNLGDVWGHLRGILMPRLAVRVPY